MGTETFYINEKYIEVAPDVKLHVSDIGKGRPVVLLHGWPESDAIFKYQYQVLAENGYRAIGITLRGFGKSDKPAGNYDFDVFSKDIQTVLDTLDLENIVLVGFSMGGLVAAHYIVHYAPACIKKLALISSSAPSLTRRDDYPHGFTVEEINSLITATEMYRTDILNVYGNLFRLDEDFMPLAIGKWINNINNEAGQEACIKSMIATRDMDLRPLLYKITLPTALFHAVDDNVFTFGIAEQAHQGIKNSTLVPFEKGGHWILIKEQDKLNAELLKFIAQF
jgi:non-heme chloroperoxidase